MHSAVLLCCVAAYANEVTPIFMEDRHCMAVEFVDRIICSLFDQMLRASTHRTEALDRTMVEKLGHLVQSSLSPSSVFALHGPLVLSSYLSPLMLGDRVQTRLRVKANGLPRKETSQSARAFAKARATGMEALQSSSGSRRSTITVKASAADAAQAAGRFQLPFDVSYPGLRVVHADPPVVLIDGFLPRKTCQVLMEAAEASGSLARAKMRISEGSREYNVLSENRTSRSMFLFDDELERGGQALRDAHKTLQDKAKVLLRRCEWGPRSREPGKLFFEYLQLSKYERGQHFLAHEDAFDPTSAAAHGFQRLATLVVYLNDVQAGGETRFEHLGVSIAPIAGTALLFFPAFADGSPDARTLHAGTSAISTKWVAQQWIASGWSGSM